jgi:YidC/Oxa1 family membrane protein insertase
VHPQLTFLRPLTNVLYTAVSWVLLRWHQLFSALGMDPNGGFTWALSIVFLVITARVLLFRFFIKQVHYTRQMQKLAPEIAKLKEKHKGDRQAQQQAMMQLQQDQGLNMLAGCLPMFLQIPVFISLFHVLRHLSNSADSTSLHQLTLYGFSKSETLSAANATLFGKAPLASSFHDSAHNVQLLGGDLSTLRTVTIVLALISAGATFLTQKQVQRNATTAPTGQAASIQKIMLYFIPLSVLVSGIIFPLGVLFYWFTSNLWTMGQQFYIYRYHPVDDDAVAAGAVAAPGRALAPRPGAKPVTRDRRPSGSTASAVPSAAAAGAGPASTDAADAVTNRSNATRASATKPSAPRAGQRPSGAKPPQKRSAQKRKRR